MYHWRFRRKGKRGKYGKEKVKRKWWALVQPPYFPQGNGRQSPTVEPFKQEDRPPDVDPGSIPDIHT